MKHLTILALLITLVSTLARADEIRPAYLEFKETSTDTFDVLFKVPVTTGGIRPPLSVILPEGAKTIKPVSTSQTGFAFIDRFTIQREGGLGGSTISIDGIVESSTETLVRIEGLEGNSQTVRLSPDSPSYQITAAPTSTEVAKTYTILGIEHILEGFDHLLFVLALIIVAGINRRLVITITGFTIAHSITLVLSTLNIVNLPIPPVEAVIALSIVFLAVEIARGDRSGLTYRYPVSVSVSFGLLHGFGFAAVLGEIGLPESEIPVSLLFFNIGVELGQLIFVGAVMILCFIYRALRIKAPAWTGHLAPYAIGSIAAYWMIDRVVGFWP